MVETRGLYKIIIHSQEGKNRIEGFLRDQRIYSSLFKLEYPKLQAMLARFPECDFTLFDLSENSSFHYELVTYLIDHNVVSLEGRRREIWYNDAEEAECKPPFPHLDRFETAQILTRRVENFKTFYKQLLTLEEIPKWVCNVVKYEIHLTSLRRDTYIETWEENAARWSFGKPAA